MRDALENLGYIALAMVGYLLLVLIVPLLLGRVELAWAVLKGFMLLWVALLLEQALQASVQKFCRLSELENPSVVVFNLLVTLTFCLFWAAFLALEITKAAQGIGWFGVALLHVLGVVGAWIGFGVVTGFFTGTLYRMAGLFVVVAAYLVFAFVPWLATGGFGWFFAFFQ